MPEEKLERYFEELVVKKFVGFMESSSSFALKKKKRKFGWGGILIQNIYFSYILYFIFNKIKFWNSPKPLHFTPTMPPANIVFLSAIT